MAAKIEWGQEQPWGNRAIAVPGEVDGLLIANLIRRHGKDTWSVHMYLCPLPDSLDRLSDTEKTSLEQAKRTAQRVLNAFTKILNGES